MGLSLKLLGEFEVRDESGEPLALPTRKTRALLAYLAVNADKPQLRDRLMTLLWSDRGEQQARHSLNQALMSIRRLGNAAGVSLLDGDGERVTLLGDAIAIDITNFRDRLANDPEGAAALYEGPFLDGLTIPDPVFEEWLTATRSELHDSTCDALSRAADQAIREADATRGTEILRRLLVLEPLREDAHRRLMKFLYEGGDRAGALRQYQACAEILEKELHVEPDTATKALIEYIRNDTSSPAASEAPTFLPKTSSAEKSPALPDRPSIAVLPFDNLGGDPNQDFFGDGIAEDIITELSRFHSLFVIARGSSFSFKGQLLDTREIAGKLGVRYVLEGSVRTQGSRIRVTAQLIDAENGRHLWSDRYDRETHDVLALQDEITTKIVGIIEPEIGEHERRRVGLLEPSRLDAWALYQRGLGYFYSSTKDSLDQAVGFFAEAVARDPEFAAAHAMRAAAIVRQFLYGRPDEREALLADGLKSAKIALHLDTRDARSYMALGRVHILQDKFELAARALDQAIALNPNFALAHHSLGLALSRWGRLEEAIKAVDQALRLSPYDPNLSGSFTVRARCLLDLNRFEEAEESASRAIESPHARYWAYAHRVAALGQLGREEEMKETLKVLYELAPHFNIAFARAVLTGTGYCERYCKLLRAAGVPE